MADQHPEFLWINGEQQRWEAATVHVSELGWSTVGAVFEGIRAYWNADQRSMSIFRLEEHLQRLMRSMKLVRLPATYSVDTLTEAILDLLIANNFQEDVYIFPMAYATDSFHAKFDDPDMNTLLHILTRPMESHLGSGMMMSAKVSSWRRISEDVMPPRVKNLSNYRNGQLARMEAMMDGYDTSLILNNVGKVAEGPGACVMMVSDGKLITPDLTSSVLESITRDALLTIAREVLGIEVIERVVDRTELYTADEVFLCGTAAEIAPVTSVDKYPVLAGEIGPVTKALETAFEDVLRNRETVYSHWRTPVPLSATAAV